ncbi:hypothetical protein KY348_07275 [Candidatus Woesearchaeota archaeon]|nr:hypothetical protein [Candidatus Woesearchaeota archaeon]
MNKKDKKAQITLFVILALIIIIVIGVIYFAFMRGEVIEEEFKEEAVPEEFKPVETYVINCIHQKGVEAIKKLGEHGGYIDPADTYLSGGMFKIYPSSPTRSEFVSFSTEEVLSPVPYYVHVPGRASSRNYEIDLEIPTIKEMEEQVSRYIKRELPMCEGDFSKLEERGFDVSASQEIEVITNIMSDDIRIYVTQKIEMTKENVKTTKSKFTSNIRFPFMKYYDLAINLTKAALFSQFTDTFTEKLIDYHAGVDFSLLPPKGTVTNHDPYIITWSKEKVKMDLQGLLLSYVPSLQINNSKNYQPITGSGIDVNFLKTSVLNTSINPELLRNIEIDFLYLDQPIDFNINPSKGDLIVPSTHLNTPPHDMIPVSYDTTYRFFYDVSWPLIIVISQETPLEIRDFKYVFALESNLIENKGILEWLIGLGTVPYSYSDLELIFDSAEVELPDPSGDTTSYTPRPYSHSLFCKEEAWVSGNIKVKAEDKETGQPLENANLIFSCGEYDDCWVGRTQIDADSGAAIWEGSLPLCQGGILSIQKNGYATLPILLSTDEEALENLGTKKLSAFKEIKIDVKKYNIIKDFVFDTVEKTWNDPAPSIDSIQPIDKDNEIVMLTFTKQEAISFLPYTTMVLFGKGVDEEVMVNLVPGSYSISASVIDDNGIHIPAYCTEIQGEKLPDKALDMKPAKFGGAEIGEATTGFFDIKASDLEKDVLEIRVIKPPYPPCIEQLQELSKIEEYSLLYKTEIWPVFR